MKYVIKMLSFYQLDVNNGYYRKQGDGCFDFVNSTQFATKFDDINEKEISSVRNYADWYMKQYNAKGLDIIQIDSDGQEAVLSHYYRSFVPVQ